MKRRGSFYRVRVAILLAVLSLVAGYAVRDWQRRSSRNDWTRTLEVAVVVLRLEAVPESSVSALRARLPELETRLAAEAKRYRPGSPKPFAFDFFGPVDVVKPPPEPASEGFVDLARHAFELWRYLSDVDEACGLSSSAYDARIYVTARVARHEDRFLVEGLSQQGGHVGTVTVELDDEMVDLALFVTAHELFHVLGADDKYDSQGNALVPGGLAEPALSPLYPQRFAEIMARNRPVSPGEEVVPESLAELAVGRETAREIGWLSP